MVESKTVQEYLEHVGFYDELEKLKNDLKIYGLTNYESKFFFESSTRWKILTREKPSFFNPHIFKFLGYYKKGEVTEISACLRWNEKQIKEIEETGGATVYKYENEVLVPAYKVNGPQEIRFNCYSCKEGDERDGFLQRVAETNITFEELKAVLREKIFWYLQDKYLK